MDSNELKINIRTKILKDINIEKKLLVKLILIWFYENLDQLKKCFTKHQFKWHSCSKFAADALLHSYKKSFNGFVAKLTEEEAMKMRGIDYIVGDPTF